MYMWEEGREGGRVEDTCKELCSILAVSVIYATGTNWTRTRREIITLLVHGLALVVLSIVRTTKIVVALSGIEVVDCAGRKDSFLRDRR